MLAARPVDQGSSRKVVVYERVSSDRQDLSRQAAQRDRARADYPGAEIEVVQDDGVSAFKVSIFNRPGGRRLCDLIETGQVAALYTDAQDRLSRGKQLEWWSFADLCEQHGTRIVIDGRELRLDNEGDEIRSSLDQILARRESQQKAHRVSSARVRDASRGLRNGGPRPFGYQQAGGKLTLVPREAEVLRRIRAEIVAGRSMSEIARGLNRDGLATATGRPWNQSRISQMLANRLYVGKVRHRDKEYDGLHEPVFTQMEWDEAQAVLSARRARPGKGVGRTPTAHLFAKGMLRCGCCGGTITAKTTTNAQDRVYRRYICGDKTSGASPDCSMPTVSSEDIDGAVVAYFADTGLDLEATRRRIAENAERVVVETRAALAHAEHDRAVIEEKLVRVRRDYQDNRINAEEWRDHRDELLDDQVAATEEVARLEARVEKVAGHVAQFDAEQDLLEKLAELRAAVAGRVADSTTVEAMRTALLRLFSGFTLHAHDHLTRHTIDEAPLPEGWLRSRTYWHPGLTPPGTHLLEPHPRREMILDADKEAAFPQLRRVPMEARVRIPASAR